MSGLGNALGGNSFIGKTIRGAFNMVTAPIHLAGDILEGKNVLQSVANRTLQGAGGTFGIVGNQLFSTGPAQKIGKQLSPVTFGLSERATEAATLSDKAVTARSSGDALSGSELWQVYRNTGEIGAVAFAAANAGAVIGAAKSAAPVAIAGKLISGKGNSSDVAALTGLDQGLVQGVGSAYEGYRDAGIGQPAPALPPQPVLDQTYPDPAFDPANNPQPKKPNTVLVLGAVGTVAVILAAASRRKKKELRE